MFLDRDDYASGDDYTGTLVVRSPEELQSRWIEVKRAGSYPQEFGKKELVSWHRRESEECKLAGNSFCAFWHKSQIAAQESSTMVHSSTN
ncbi:hypothetical protein RFM99_26315 [Mesorhizobium sp. VK4C]|uniref:hypothetical protein n=1 Tax=Mesorhizobium captivum TaxID=3072319 RepID=UPI002A23B583|nr:hypothetical protein [Mesorhizobium sp. VK4C]MDX8501914.1 hypothetical protein [Mesorhizobium sp. VK4C]